MAILQNALPLFLIIQRTLTGQLVKIEGGFLNLEAVGF